MTEETQLAAEFSAWLAEQKIGVAKPPQDILGDLEYAQASTDDPAKIRKIELQIRWLRDFIQRCETILTPVDPKYRPLTPLPAIWQQKLAELLDETEKEKYKSRVVRAWLRFSGTAVIGLILSRVVDIPEWLSDGFAFALGPH
jgi:hypothetical protein